MTPEELEKAIAMTREAVGEEAASYFQAIMLGLMPGKAGEPYSYEFCEFIDDWLYWEFTPQKEDYWENINKLLRRKFGSVYSKLVREKPL